MIRRLLARFRRRPWLRPTPPDEEIPANWRDGWQR